MGLQYRVAAVSGAATQLLWGLMECLAFMAFQRSAPEAYPMAVSATVSYVWLREAFFSAFTTWNADQDIFDSIVNGGIAYELCRPVSIYHMWFAKTTASRAAGAGLRCIPLLLAASILPRPYRLATSGEPAALCFVYDHAASGTWCDGGILHVYIHFGVLYDIAAGITDASYFYDRFFVRSNHSAAFYAGCSQKHCGIAALCRNVQRTAFDLQW